MSEQWNEAPVDKRKLLKIKVKSLAAEAKIIRKEEFRSNRQTRDALYWHRIFVVRTEARATHVAYGLIRGRTYKQIEQNPKGKPDWDKVKAMLKKYGPPDWETVLKKAA